MPIFEYVCDDCSRRFEELISSDKTDVPCPECGSSNTKKLLSVFAASAGSVSTALPCGQSGCGKGFT